MEGTQNPFLNYSSIGNDRICGVYMAILRITKGKHLLHVISIDIFDIDYIDNVLSYDGMETTFEECNYTIMNGVIVIDITVNGEVEL